MTILTGIKAKTETETNGIGVKFADNLCLVGEGFQFWRPSPLQSFKV